jgi:hypothetical protein
MASGVPVPEGFTVTREYNSFAAREVIVVHKGGRNIHIDPQASDNAKDIDRMIIEAVEAIRAAEQAEKRYMEDKETIALASAMNAAAAVSGSGIWTGDGGTWTVPMPTVDPSDWVTYAAPVRGPQADILLLKAAYSAAQACDYLTTLEIGNEGVVIEMRDGDDYTLGMVPWSMLAPSVMGNPISDMIQTLAGQRNSGGW